MKREIEPAINKQLLSRDNSVLIIEGARQVGKTYTVKAVLNSLDRPFLSFDLEKDNEIRRKIDNTEDFEDFRALMFDQYNLKPGTLLFFDEAQESKQLPRYIKSFKEDLPDVQLILTGSSMNRFFAKDMRIPVGRYRTLCLFGFSFAEFVEFIHGTDLADFIRSTPEKVPPSRHEMLLELFDNYLHVGGYPEAVKAFSADADWSIVIDEIMASLQEDFERKEEFQPKLFRDAITAISNHIGSPSKLTQFDATKYHAKRILESLEKWHIAMEVEPQSLNPDKGGNFLSKRYLYDTGVINRRRSMVIPPISLIKTIDPMLRTPLGGIFENAVLIQLLSGESAFHKIGTWKKDSKTDIEVDFILDYSKRGMKIPIECKAAREVKKKHYKNILQYLSLSQQKYGVLVTAAPLQVITCEDKKIFNIPVYLAKKENITGYIESDMQE